MLMLYTNDYTADKTPRGLHEPSFDGIVSISISISTYLPAVNPQYTRYHRRNQYRERIGTTIPISRNPITTMSDTGFGIRGWGSIQGCQEHATSELNYLLPPLCFISSLRFPRTSHSRIE